MNAPVVGLAPTPTNRGYWLVASDGGLFSFGDAGFYGSLGATPLNQPITTMIPQGAGYMMVAADGGIFNFGSSRFHGSLGDRALAAPVVTATVRNDLDGYLLVDRLGEVTAFGPGAAVLPPGERPLDPEAIVVPATTEVVEPAAIESLTTDPVTGSSLVTLRSSVVQVGDVLAAGVGPASPGGFLGRVTRVEVLDGERVVVTTAPASLVEAVPRGRLRVPAGTTSRVVRAAADVPTDSAGCGTSVNLASVNPTFDFTAGADVSLAWSGDTGVVGYVELAGSATAGVDITTSAGITCSISRTFDGPRTTLYTGVLPGPVPFPIVIQTRPVLVLSGSVSVKAATSFHGSVTGALTVGWVRGDASGTYFRPTLTRTGGLSPGIVDTGSIRAEVFSGLKLEIDTADIGEAGLSLDATAEMSPCSNPWWKISVGARAKAALSISAGRSKFTFGELTQELMSPVVLADSGGPAVPLPDRCSSDGTWNGTVGSTDRIKESTGSAELVEVQTASYAVSHPAGASGVAQGSFALTHHLDGGCGPGGGSYSEDVSSSGSASVQAWFGVLEDATSSTGHRLSFNVGQGPGAPSHTSWTGCDGSSGAYDATFFSYPIPHIGCPDLGAEVPEDLQAVHETFHCSVTSSAEGTSLQWTEDIDVDMVRSPCDETVDSDHDGMGDCAERTQGRDPRRAS